MTKHLYGAARSQQSCDTSPEKSIRFMMFHLTRWEWLNSTLKNVFGLKNTAAETGLDRQYRKGVDSVNASNCGVLLTGICTVVLLSLYTTVQCINKSLKWSSASTCFYVLAYSSIMFMIHYDVRTFLCYFSALGGIMWHILWKWHRAPGFSQ